IGKIHQLQDGKKSIDTATQGQEIACSIQDVTIGRQIEEEDVFYSMPNSREAKIILEKFMHKLNPEQQTVFNEIVALLRAKDASYGYI
ncbi:MAG: translation initiation factor IF-2, partial [Nitrososphaeria archaeon]|nr:translation initiation factor IF-2 [Nitrososphaeria archaeon]